VKADTKAIQAIHLIVVTHNPRVSVEHIGSSQWKLIIKNVRKEDAGFYMAQISKSVFTAHPPPHLGKQAYFVSPFYSFPFRHFHPFKTLYTSPFYCALVAHENVHIYLFII
jgi:hypothetical protein